MLEDTKPYRIAAIVISKSGTTTEPAVAFRLIKKEIENRYGTAEAAKRIVAVTDAARGALRTLATNEGYATFVIPDNVGGRYSVLTPVGLLPLAAAGINVDELVRGAQDMEKATAVGVPFEQNPSMIYAAARTALYRAGKKSKFWPATILNCFMCQNGGNNFTVKVKVKMAKAFSLPA